MCKPKNDFTVMLVGAIQTWSFLHVMYAFIY